MVGVHTTLCTFTNGWPGAGLASKDRHSHGSARDIFRRDSCGGDRVSCDKHRHRGRDHAGLWKKLELGDGDEPATLVRSASLELAVGCLTSLASSGTNGE